MKHLLRFFVLPFVFFFVSTLVFQSSYAETPITVSSKGFTESFIMGEAAALLLESSGYQVHRRFGIDSNGLIYGGLEAGEIDLYLEYSGTLKKALFAEERIEEDSKMRAFLAKKKIWMSAPLGFNNTYSMAVPRRIAKERNLRKISDLKGNPLSAAFTYGFIERVDGYKALLKHYSISFREVKSMEHSLCFEALQNGEAEIMDAFATDAKTKAFDFVVLEDDLNFFPRYDALFIARENLPKEVLTTLAKLEGRISTELMKSINAIVDIEKRSYREAAISLLNHLGLETPQNDGRTLVHVQRDFLLQMTKEHLYLLVVALLFAVLIGFPLGVISFGVRSVGQAILSLSGLLQTIPALALLCFLIPLSGIGMTTAIVALFLYSLLPIVRGVVTGLQDIPASLRETASALGLSRWQSLLRIEIPLASRSILSGIKTSAILCVGNATLAAFIGAGGYGTAIIQGLSMNRISTILLGAVPAAVLALCVHFGLEALGHWLIPKGLRRATARG